MASVSDIWEPPTYLIEIESSDYKSAESSLKKALQPVLDVAKKSGVDASFKRAK